MQGLGIDFAFLFGAPASTAAIEVLSVKGKLRADFMEEARKLLETGQVQKALVLAMDILGRELQQLQEALQAIRDNLSSTPDASAAAPRSEFFRPDPPSRLLH